jgi:hypothetical protein
MTIFPNRGRYVGLLIGLLAVLFWLTEARADRGVSGPDIPDTVCAWDSIAPGAVVYNFGGLNEEFYAFCEIDSVGAVVYVDSMMLSLGPGSNRHIVFREWGADGPGNSYTVTIYLSPPDSSPSNDTVSAMVTVIECPGIEEENRAGVRPCLCLQNRPNPFHGSTVISYSLPQATHITLAIYDITGRLVETLVNETQEPGIHQVEWSPEGMPAAVYFCRLRAGEFVRTRKMLLVK